MKVTSDHVGIFTMNAKAMKEFYANALGFETGSESILAKALVNDIFGVAADCRFVKMHKDGFVLEIFEPQSSELKARMANQVGINHWGYCVPDRATLVQKLRRNGAPLIELERNDHIVYFLIDPDGNRIELRQCLT